MKTSSKAARIVSILTAALIIITFIPHSALAADAHDAKAVLEATMAQLAVTVPEPVFGTGGGEWTVLSLARGEYFEKDSEYFEGYYDRIVAKVAELADESGALHSRKYTENSRLIMALSSIGKDPTDVGGIDIVAPLNDYAKTVWQGINGPIFALIALDTNNYKTEDETIRQQYIDYILDKEIAGGGWALSGSNADPDITAMALQALANYRDQAEVAEAANRAFGKLSAMQKDDGGYASWGSVNSESIAQVIVACCAWGIDPASDGRFVKNGISAVDALLAFYSEDDAAFRHIMSSSVNAMATDQACYALVAYDRFVNNKNSLYDMTDAFESENDDYIIGDLNCDGIVNIKDCNMMKRVLAKVIELEDERTADINGDGHINAIDSNLLRHMLLGIYAAAE